MFKSINENKKIYEKVIDQIQELISNGELKKGDKLPPERELAETLGVGRPTLKQALSGLEVMGVIESRHGEGNYISDDNMSFINPLTMDYYINQGNSSDVVELRYMLETQMAKVVAKSATEDDIKILDTIVDDMEKCTTQLDLKELNTKFHIKFAELSGNVLIIGLYKSMATIISDKTMLVDLKEFSQGHREIVDGIRSRDAKRTSQAMKVHYLHQCPNYED